MERKILIIGLLLLCLCFAADAQYDQYLVERVTVGQQMSKRNIFSIAQGQQGFLWMASSTGLIRFDGYSIKLFSQENDSAQALPTNSLRKVFVDEQQSMWICTQGKGLIKFDEQKELFASFMPAAGSAPSHQLQINDFFDLCKGKDNRLWVASFHEGVYCFDTKLESFKHYALWNDSIPQAHETTSVLEDKEGRLWVGTHEGLLRFHLKTGLLELFKAENTSRLNSNRITCLYQTRDGTVWVGTEDAGISYISPKSKQFNALTADASDACSLADNAVYCFLEDEYGNLWIGTDGGLHILDRKTGCMTKLQHNPHDAMSLSTNRVRSIYRDRSGIYWVGNDGGGLHKIVRKKKFMHYKPGAMDGTFLSSNVVRAFAEDSAGNIWVGTQGGGINILNPRTNSFEYLISANKPGELTDNEATCFFFEKEACWVGTWGGGLNRIDLASRKVTQVFRHAYHDQGALHDDRIQFCRKDAKGNMWVGTENGLHRLEGGHFARFLNNPSDTYSISANNTQSLAFSAEDDGSIWVGTWFGLNKFDAQEGRFTHWLHHADDENSLSANQVIALHDDRKGNLWIGTFDGGLNKLHKKTGKITVYNKDKGLPDNVIFGILEDEQGHLWLSTNNGLADFDPKTERVRHFDLIEGIQGKEFWWGAAYKCKNGEMLFGGTNGFTRFHPDSIQDNGYKPPMAITSFKVYNREVPIPEDRTIRLSYRDNFFSIEFAALDFTDPEKNQYAYQLEGLEEGWVYSGGRHSVSYAYIEGGEYIFKVKGTNSDGLWVEEPLTLRIIVTPPIWQTPVFIVAVALGFFAFIYFLYLLRIKQIQEQQVKLEAVVQERTKQLATQHQELQAQKAVILEKSEALEAMNQELIEMDNEKNYLISVVAHDLRSPLNHIKGLVKIIQLSDKNLSKETATYLQMMEQSIQQQAQMIAKILDVKAIESKDLNLHLEHVESGPLTEQIIAQFAESAAAKSIALSFAQAANMPRQAVYADRNYLTQVLQNLISNALKFSPKGSAVEVGLSFNNRTNRIQWAVADRGPGISKADQRKLFQKYQRLSARPTAGEASIGLGLSIVKRYVEAMNGNVWCESEEGNGATFFVEMPTPS